MKLAGGHLWSEQTRLQSWKGSLGLLLGDYDPLRGGDAGDACGDDCGGDPGGETEPGDSLNSRGNPDTQLLAHDETSPPTR